jgi:hypothetical protein
MWIKRAMPTTSSPDALHVVKETIGTQSPQTAKEAISKRRDRRNYADVSWYGRLLIFGMLLVAGGWELFRLILAIMTLD